MSRYSTQTSVTADTRARLPLICLLLFTVGCARHIDLPDVGPQLPYSAKLEIAPSVAGAASQYTDSCGHLFDLRYGTVVEDALIEATHRMFKTVSMEGSGPKDSAPAYVIKVDLTYSKFTLKQDNLYDRVPAELTLSGSAKIQDQSGKVLREPEIQVTRQERVRIEPLQKNCNYILDPLVKDAAIEFATKYTNELRAALVPGAPTTAAGAVGPQEAPGLPSQPGASPGTQASPPDVRLGGGGLSFKTTVLDENGNLVLEGGERVKLRVDIVNAGMMVARDVAVTLTGTPSFVTQFPATTLPIGPLQPGESRSVEFATTVPQTFPEQQAELIFTLSESSGVPLPPRRTLDVAVRATVGSAPKTGAGADSVDQLPTGLSGFHRPNAYVVAIGAGTLRDQKASVRKFAGPDADLVAGYFGALGGIPPENVRVLKDRGASRPDIEEALLDWLPGRITPESLIVVYYSGQALVAPSGEVALVPYDAGKSFAKGYLLKDLQAELAKLKARTVLLVVDGSVVKAGGDGKTKHKAPQWDTGSAGIMRLIGSSGFGSGLEPDQLKHGLFTYNLLRGIRKDADSNGDGEVTVGELSAYLAETVPGAAKSDFGQEQHPQSVPPVSPSSKAGMALLTKTTSGSSSIR
ncbi:MAG: hypothetical protein HZB35_09305 [Nitrospirae bacterium]|nr:hypothetical protein [Nitrospirota bacterium]